MKCQIKAILELCNKTQSKQYSTLALECLPITIKATCCFIIVGFLDSVVQYYLLAYVR